MVRKENTGQEILSSNPGQPFLTENHSEEGLRHRFLYPVRKPETFSPGFKVPVRKPVPKALIKQPVLMGHFLVVASPTCDS